MADEYIQTNVSITKEDAEKLDKLMQLHFLDNRSAFIRRLIRQEWVRVTGEPVSVVDAMLQSDTSVSENVDNGGIIGGASQ